MSAEHVSLHVEPGPIADELTELLRRSGLNVNVTAATGAPLVEVEGDVVRGAPDIRTFAYVAGVNLSREQALVRQREIEPRT